MKDNELYNLNKGMNLTQEMARAYEARSKRDAFMAKAPVIARVSARGFETTDFRVERDRLGHSRAMYEVFVNVADVLVDQLRARVAYVWGDEITLLLHEADLKKEVFCEGRRYMIDSAAAGLATAAFTKHAHAHAGFARCEWETYPHFQCVSFDVPTLEVAARLFSGYQLDNRRNVSLRLYQSTETKKPLYRPKFRSAIEMAAKAGMKWADLPVELRRGAFLRRWKRPEPSEATIGLGMMLGPSAEERRKQKRPEALERVEHLWLHAVQNVEGWLLAHEAPVEDMTVSANAER